MINTALIGTQRISSRGPLSRLWEDPSVKQREELAKRIRDLRAKSIPAPAPVLENKATKTVVSLGLNVTHFAPRFSAYHRTRALVVRAAAARVFDITEDDLTGKRRNAEIVFCRHMAMFAVHMLTDKSLPETGRLFGGRDHTTALHGIKKGRDAYCAGEERAVQAFWKIRYAAISVEGIDPFFWGS